MFGNEGVDLIIGDAVCAGLNFTSAIGDESRLLENLPRQPDAGAHVHPIVWMAHIVEKYLGLVVRVGTFEGHCTPAF